MHGKWHIFWFKPNCSPSSNDWGNCSPKVSGNNNVSKPPAIPQNPSIKSGKIGETTPKCTMIGDIIVARYPVKWMNETPCPRTTVGRSSAAYCMPMLNEKFTKNRPNMITIVVARPVGMKTAMTLHNPLRNIVPKPKQRLPHRSRRSVTKVDAGNSVAAASPNPRNGFNPIDSMLRT